MIQALEQVSPEPETCTRCAQLKRGTVINPGERHWAILRDGDPDSRPRVILCEPCRRFVKKAMLENR